MAGIKIPIEGEAQVNFYLIPEITLKLIEASSIAEKLLGAVGFALAGLSYGKNDLFFGIGATLVLFWLITIIIQAYLTYNTLNDKTCFIKAKK